MAAEEKGDLADSRIAALKARLQGAQENDKMKQTLNRPQADVDASDFEGCIPKGRLELLEQKSRQARGDSEAVCQKLRGEISRQSMQIVQLEQVIEGLKGQLSLLRDELLVVRLHPAEQERNAD